MTLVRKGTRRITVDGTTYRWRIGKDRTCAPGQQSGGVPTAFVVEGADAPGNPLVVTLSPARVQAEPEPVTPARVATAVRSALAEGWCPGDRGGPFRLDGSAL